MIPSFNTVEDFEAFWSQVPDLIEIEIVAQPTQE